MGIDDRCAEVLDLDLDLDAHFGGIVTVTPSCKCVDDLALFLLCKGMAAADVIELMQGRFGCARAPRVWAPTRVQDGYVRTVFVISVMKMEVKVKAPAGVSVVQEVCATAGGKWWEVRYSRSWRERTNAPDCARFLSITAITEIN
jgi:hypothetical protein